VSVTGDGRTSVPPETLQGPAGVILLHGLFGDGDNLKGLASRLTGDRCAWRPHLPAHGDVAATSPLSFAAMADELAGRVSAEAPAGLSSGQPLHLVGHSLGGKVAMTLAARDDAFAQRIRSLCVLDIGPRRYPPHHDVLIDALRGLDTEALASRREADAALRRAVPEAGIRAFLLKGLVRDGDAWRWRYDLDAIAEHYATHLAAALPEAPPCALPTLFLAGGDSDYLGDADRDAARQRFPNARIDTIAGCGHWLHAERADEVAAVIDAHLQAVDAALVAR